MNTTTFLITGTRNGHKSYWSGFRFGAKHFAKTFVFDEAESEMKKAVNGILVNDNPDRSPKYARWIDIYKLKVERI